MSIGIRPREFPNALTTMLASQEGMNTAVSLQGDDVLALVDILDQVGREMIIGAPRLITLDRLSRLRTCRLTSGERVSAPSGESVVHRPSYLVLAYSRRTSRRRATPHSLPEGSRMSGRVATMGIVCASKRSELTPPRIYPKSNRFVTSDFTLCVRL